MAATLLVLGLWLLSPGSGVASGPGPQLSGVVTDLFGSVIPGAEIELLDADGRVLDRVRSDEKGAYAFGKVPEGVHRIRGSLDGFLPSQHRLEVGRGEVVQRDLGLHVVDLVDSPGCRLCGRLVDRDGEGLAGIRIKAVGAFDPELSRATESRQEGRFCFTVTPSARYLVFLHGEDSALRPVAVDCVGGAEIEVEFPRAP